MWSVVRQLLGSEHHMYSHPMVTDGCLALDITHTPNPVFTDLNGDG